MNNQTTATTATILSTVGVLFMLAMAFGVLPANIALFAGVASFVIAGVVWSLGGRNRQH